MNQIIVRVIIMIVYAKTELRLRFPSSYNNLIHKLMFLFLSPLYFFSLNITVLWFYC